MGDFTPSFTLVINCIKPSVRPKSFNYIISYPMTDHQAFLVHSQYFVWSVELNLSKVLDVLLGWHQVKSPRGVNWKKEDKFAKWK